MTQTCTECNQKSNKKGYISLFSHQWFCSFECYKKWFRKNNPLRSKDEDK